MSEITGPFDLINMISHTKEIPDFDPVFDKHYSIYVTNMFFSFFRDTALIVNFINTPSRMSSKAHFMFLHSTIPKRKRFTKWYKPEQESDNEKMISEVYNVGLPKARIMLSLLTEGQLDLIRQSRYIGGTKK